MTFLEGQNYQEMEKILLIHRVLSSQADENEITELDRLLSFDIALKRDFIDMKFLIENAASPPNADVPDADWSIFETRITKGKEPGFVGSRRIPRRENSKT